MAYGLDEISQTTTAYAVDGTPTTQTLVFAHDGHGSVRAVLDLAGAALQRYAFDAYGNALGFDPAAALTSRLYNGEQFDRATNTYNFRARFYDPARGRFTTLDPFFGGQTDPLSFNKYLFAHANPVMGVDPTGWAGDFTIAGLFGGSSIQSNLNATKVGGALVVLDRASTAYDVFQFAATFVFTGVLDPIALAFFLPELIPFAGRFFKLLKPISSRIIRPGLHLFAVPGAIRALQRVYDTAAAAGGITQKVVQEIGEVGAGLAARAENLIPTNFRPKYKGIDSVFTDAKGNIVIVEAKGGSGRLGITVDGNEQMSRGWIDAKIRELRGSSDPLDRDWGRQLQAARDADPTKLRGMVVKTKIDDAGNVLAPEYAIQDYGGIGADRWLR